MALLLSCLSLAAQDKDEITITGKIIDEAGEQTWQA